MVVCDGHGQTLDIAAIDVPVLRLDHRNDRPRREETVERICPRLVVLDPLVRLLRVDENAVADIAPVLGFLRDLQRRFEAVVLVVHHSRKSGTTRPGQALRGSSELHDWGDSNLYLPCVLKGPGLPILRVWPTDCFCQAAEAGDTARRDLRSLRREGRRNGQE